MSKQYGPYEIGRQLYRDGLGMSDIPTAVRTDADIPECYEGYSYEQNLAEYKKLKHRLGYQ